MPTTTKPSHIANALKPRNLTSIQQICLLQRLIVHDAEHKNADAALRVRAAAVWAELEEQKNRLRAWRDSKRKPKPVEQPRAPEPSMIEDDPAAGDPPTA